MKKLILLMLALFVVSASAAFAATTQSGFDRSMESLKTVGKTGDSGSIKQGVRDLKVISSNSQAKQIFTDKGWDQFMNNAAAGKSKTIVTPKSAEVNKIEQTKKKMVKPAPKVTTPLKKKK